MADKGSWKVSNIQKGCRLTWFKGISWGYIGIWVSYDPLAIQWAWTPFKSEAAKFTKEDAEAFMKRWSTEKLELEEI